MSLDSRRINLNIHSAVFTIAPIHTPERNNKSKGYVCVYVPPPLPLREGVVLLTAQSQVSASKL